MLITPYIDSINEKQKRTNMEMVSTKVKDLHHTVIIHDHFLFLDSQSRLLNGEIFYQKSHTS